MARKFFLVFFLLLLSTRSSFAQVNLGGQWTPSMVVAQADKLGPNSTITIMASPTDYPKLQQTFNSLGNRQVTIIVRSYKQGQAFTTQDAKSMAATLGSINTQNRIVWMPWNEPNDYTIEAKGLSRSELAQRVAQVQQAAFDSIEQAGLSGKITVLSPMFNLWNGPGEVTDANGDKHIGASEFIAEVQAAANNLGFNFMDKFNGWSVNWYAFPNASTTINNKPVLQYLNELGVPQDKPIWGIEAGALTSTGVTYNVSTLEAFLTNFQQQLLADPALASRLAGFTIFAYDPLGNKSLYLFQAQTLYNLFQQMKQNGILTPAESSAFDEAAFKAWLAAAGIIECKNDKGELIGFAPTKDECKGLSGSPYLQERLVDGSNDTALAYSDPVKLVQRGAINKKLPSTTYTRGGFFEEFQDNTLPFAKTMLNYLVGPFVAEFGQDEKRANLVNNPRIEDAGPYARLAPLYIQNQLRTKFRDNCVARKYTESECTTIDPDSKEKIDIAQINPPPTLDVTAEYTAWVANDPINSKRWYMIPLFANPETEVKKSVYMNACPPGGGGGQDETTVDSIVPYVSALKDVSQELNKMFTNPPQKPITFVPSLPTEASAKAGQPSTNNYQFVNPVLAQNPPPDDSNFNPFAPNFAPDISSLGGKQYQICWNLNPVSTDENYNFCDWGYSVTVSVKGVVSASFAEPVLGGNSHCFKTRPHLTCTMGSAHPLVVSANSKEEIQVNFAITSGSCTGAKCQTIDFRQRMSGASSPSAPTCNTPSALGGKNPNGDEDPIALPGHALLREPHQDLSCNSWLPDGLTCADRATATDYVVKDPVWAEVKYPFIGTIHKFLAGPQGIFNIFRPPEKEKDKWNEPAKSKISYCLKDFPDSEKGANSMIKGGSLDQYQVPFSSPPARCDKNLATKTLSAYPPLLGGIDNAREWIFSMFNASKSPSSSQTIQKPNTEDFTLGPSRMQTAIEAVQNTFSPTTAKPVKKGDTIGLMGNTGLSTGPHLHFAVYNYKLGDPFIANQNLINPCGGLLTCSPSNNTISNGSLSVPMNNPTITQWFGQTPDSASLYNGASHYGIDLISSDTTILAAGDGNAFTINGGQYLGNGVIIYHPNGTMSLYWHLQ